MNHIAVVGIEAQAFEHWDDAVQHVVATTATDRASLWMGGTTGGVWIFAGRNAAREGRQPVAWITSRLDYQMAKSRGDLADLAEVHDFFSRRAGVSRSGPAITQTLEHLTVTPMPTKAPAQTLGVETVRLHVHRPLTWKGHRYVAKDTLVVSLENMEDQHVKAWLTHGWVHDLRNGAPPTAAAPETQPQTLKQLLGVNVGDVLRTKTHGDRWKIRTWRHNAEEGVLLSIDAEKQVKRGGLVGHDGRPIKNCVRRADVIIAEGGSGEIFEIVGAAEAKTSPSPEPETPAVPGASESAFREIPLAVIWPSPHNPRKRFDEAALRELADSIRAQGIIQPIVVRPRGAGSQHDGFEIIAGERRYRAAKLAGLTTVPCLVRRLDDAAAALAQGIENLQRADLDPMEECEGYELLMRQAKLTVPQIAQKTGRSEASIYARLKLQECPPGLKVALREGRVPASTAELVARQEDPVFRHQCMDAILHPEKGQAEEGSDVLSFRQAKAWIEEKRRLWQHEEAWRKTAQGSHAAKTAARVLNVLESNEVLYSGGFLRGNQYVKPTDTCYDDPERRTFAKVAEAAGIALPAPILAREPGEGKPVVLLPRAATEKAIAPLIPDAGEAKRRREVADLKRREEQVRAQERRKEKERLVVERAAACVGAVRTGCGVSLDLEDVLRFTVGSLLATLAIDYDDLAHALRDLGVPVEEGEEATVAAPEWRQEYLRGCAPHVLHAWLMWFAIRDQEFYEARAIDEDRLWAAEILLGLREPGPQPSADDEDEEDEDVEEVEA